MTKKDFTKIANILKDTQRMSKSNKYAVMYIVGELNNMFEEDNPNFDRGRFIEAVFPKKEG
jgi:hypothetical protein